MFCTVQLPLIRRTRPQSALNLLGNVHRGREFEGGSWLAAARLHARLLYPPMLYSTSGHGCCHAGGGGNAKVLTLTVLLTQSSQVLVLEKNMTLDPGKDCPGQNGALVYPILKKQGGQVCLIAHPHPRGTS